MKIATALVRLILLLPLCSVAVADSGRELYQRHCSVCHGADGAGGVGVPLNLADFLAVADDGYLRQTIRNGRPGRVMPAFPMLEPGELDSLVAYLRSLSNVPAPTYTSSVPEGDAVRGKELYETHCAACHGVRGDGGVGTGVTFSRPREAPVMAPALNNPGFQQAASDAMLKATLLRGRHGTPMPSLESLGLQNEDADDLIAYLRSLKPATRAPVPEDPDTVILQESSYDMQQTLENLKQAVIGRNFRVIREQYLDEGLVEAGDEDPGIIMLYFCNFAFVNEALAIDPRVGLFLPCRITLVDTGHGVQVMSINPKKLSHLFNNRELDKACQRMHDTYTEIIDEATL